MSDNYFDVEESKNTLYQVFDLVKQSLKERMISKKSLYDVLYLISNKYIDNFNRNEFELFLWDPTYSTTEHIVFPAYNKFLIKHLTFLFLIPIYSSSLNLEAEKLLKKEVIKILICLNQNVIEDKKVFDFFTLLDNSLLRLKSKQRFINRILVDEGLQMMEESQTCLTADFFFGYLNQKKPLKFSTLQLKNMLAKLESK